MSANAVYSNIFTLNTVGAMTQELKSLFLIEQSYQSICSVCNNAVIKKTSIFVLFITSLNLHQKRFESYVSEAILSAKTSALYCDLCREHSGDVQTMLHFVTLPTFLTVQLSSNCIDKVFFPLTTDVLGHKYVLKGMVRCISHHFTVTVKDDTRCVYIDDMCVSAKSYASFRDLLHSHLKGWFFAIFEKYPIKINNDMQLKSKTNETLPQDSKNLLVGTSAIDIHCGNSRNICTPTKSSAIAFYAVCFSVLKPCSHWNSNTIDAIVENGSVLFIEIIKYQASSSEMPQNINMCGANMNINLVSSSKGTLICTSYSSKVGLERSILQIATRNAVFLLYVPTPALF